MIQIKSKLRKWGNSFGIVIPTKTIEDISYKEGDEVMILISKDNDNTLKESFGTYKFKKNTEEILKEVDKELYDD
jgi:antitoxin component of MazEF toxin-antitoxin module